jgi:hypothetical protein
MLQLIAYSQDDNTPTYLDIDTDEDISLNFAVSEIQDFSTRKSSSSNNFTLPFTNTNNQFFGGIYNVNLATGKFDVYKKTNCQLLINSLTQIQGYLYVESINLTTENYSVVIIGETGNLIDEIGEKKLQNLDDTWQNTFRHLLTKDNIVASWDDNITYQGSATDKSVIKYPFVNYGIDNKVWTLGGANSNDITNALGAIQPYEFKPAMKMVTIFDRIFAEAGYSYDSQFFSTSGFNIYDTYMTLANNNDIVKFRPVNEYFLANLSSTQSITGGGGLFYKILFDNEVQDLQNNFNTGTSLFTAPLTGTYEFGIKVIASFTETGAETQANYNVYVFVNGVITGGLGGNTITPNGSGNTVSELFQGVFRVNLNATDTVGVYIEAALIPSGVAPSNFNVLSTLSGSDTEIKLMSQPYIVNGSEIYLQDNWPDISQKNFLKSIFEHFNMFIEPKQDNPKELIIDPYPIYMDRGSLLDWTNKIDLSKEVQITPTINFRKEKLKWQWSPDVNYLAKYRQEISQKNYGSYIYEDQSDLINGEFTNSTEFGEPTNRLINISGTTAIYEICVMDLTARDSSGGAVPLKGKPRFAYFKKKDLTAGRSFLIYNEDLDLNDSITSYGYFGHYSDVPATSGVFNLNWSDTYSGIYNFGIWVTEGTVQNPFLQYWKEYLNEIYSDESRMFSAYFNLNALDIHNLRFNNKIFVKDAFYRINSISGYKPNNTQPCKVQLIKLFESSEGLGNKCNLKIGSFEQSGIVNFLNSVTDLDADPTKECCEAYGYNWIASGDNGDCYWKNLTGPNGNPFEPTPNSSGEG